MAVVYLQSFIHAGPPNILKGGQCETISIFGIVECNVGTSYCISDHAVDLPLVRQIVLNCLHDLTASITPYPLRRTWFLSRVPIDDAEGQLPSNFITTSADGQTLVITSAVNAVRGSYTCQLNNTAGSDVATSIISNCDSK